MKKYSLEEVRAFSPKLLLTLINRLRSYLKKNEQMISIFKEYGVEIEEIDFIPMTFSDLDVSARTDHGVIYFNYKLLCDGDFFKDFGYGVHEITHWLQQTTGTGPTQGAEDGDYLENPYEIEGFQNQIEWLSDNFGKEHAEEYVDDMLSYHDLEGKEKEEKADELTAKI